MIANMSSTEQGILFAVWYLSGFVSTLWTGVSINKLITRNDIIISTIAGLFGFGALLIAIGCVVATTEDKVLWRRK